MAKGSWFHGKISDAIASTYFKKAMQSACHNVDDYVPANLAAAIKYFARQYGTHENAVLASLLTTTAATIAGNVVVKLQPDTPENMDYVPSLNVLTIGPAQRNLDEAIKKCSSEILEKIEKISGKKIMCNVNTTGGKIHRSFGVIIKISPLPPQRRSPVPSLRRVFSSRLRPYIKQSFSARLG